MAYHKNLTGADLHEPKAHVNSHFFGGSDTRSAFPFPSGSVSAPSLYFNARTGSGFYEIAANNIGCAINGSKVIDVSSVGVGVVGRVTASTGMGIASGQKLYLDGTGMAGDSYLIENANTVDLYAGGILVCSLSPTSSYFGVAAGASLAANATGIVIGAGASGVDYGITVNGSASDGLLSWITAGDYWQFGDDVLIPNGERIYFKNAVGTTVGSLYEDSGVCLLGSSNSSVKIGNNNGFIYFQHSGGSPFTAGVIPSVDNEFDLGAVGNEFKDLRIDGKAYIDELGETLLIGQDIQLRFIDEYSYIVADGDGFIKLIGFEGVTISGPAGLKLLNQDDPGSDIYLLPAAGNLSAQLSAASKTFSVVHNSTTILQSSDTGVNIAGIVQCDSFRIDQTPAAGTITPDKTVTINLNGTNYKFAVVAA